MPRTPENSTSERSLTAAGAAIDLLDAATSSEVLSGPVALDAIATVIRASGDVRPYQREELVEWLADRLGVDVPGEGEDVDGDEATER